MVSCRNIMSGIGSFLVGTGAAVYTVTAFRTATDTTIAKAAAACIKMQTVVETATGSSTLSKIGSLVKTGARFVLPNGVARTEDAITNICESAIRINGYSTHIAIGTGLIALGAFAFSFSRCFSVKCKEE